MTAELGSERAQRWLHRGEDALLVLAVLAMVVLAGLQIVLRNVFGAGLLWIEPMLRALVLWIGLLGAVAASRGGRHIAIDILTRALPVRARNGLQGLACLFTTVVCAALAWQAVRYVGTEYSFSDTAFIGVPTWAVVVILPIAFGLIGLRYALFAVAFFRGRPPFDESTS